MLNKNALLNKYKIKTSLAFIAFVLLTTLCCGKRTPPLPPTEKVSQRTTISGFQQGDQIILNWKMPPRNTSPNDTVFIERVDVYRLTEPLSSTQEITEEEFSNKSTLIETIPVNETDFSLNTLTFRDELKFSDQNARLRYAVRFVNKSGQKAAFSNLLTIEPSAKIAGRPEKLETELSQEAVLLKWLKPETNVDGSTPVNILGFNIYRKAEKESEAKKLNSSPVSGTSFADNFFEFDKKYFYSVRSVSIGTSGQPVESVSSAEIEFQPKDTFSPSAPDGITIAASPTSISLFFAANPEKDIAGYKVYRSTSEDLPTSEWELLTDGLLKTNTFQDQKISSGKKYFYYIVAVDNFGNSSEPSKITGETAP